LRHSAFAPIIEVAMRTRLQSVWQDVGHACRWLRRDPVFTLVALLTLALGIGANTAIFSVIDTVLLKALPYPDANRLVVLDENRREHGSRTVSWMDFLDWRAQNRVFDDLAAYRLSRISLSGDGREATLLHAAEVSAPFFDLLGARPDQGRVFGHVDDTPGASRTVIVSHDLWLTRLNGRADAIGQSIDLDGSPYTVIGVLPAAFEFFDTPVDVYVPVGLHGDDPEWQRRGNHPDLLVLGRLRRDATLSSARAAFDIVMRGLEARYPQSNAGLSATIVGLYEFRYGRTRTVLVALLAAVACLLLIASANIANLLLARASSRAKEIATRAALGASQWRLVQQMVVESLVLSLAGGVLGLLLAMVVLPGVLATAPEQVARRGAIPIDRAILAFTSAVSIASGLVFGCAPALHAARQTLVTAFNDTGRSGGASRSGQRIRSALLVGEIAIALILLTSAGLTLRSLVNSMTSDPGIVADHRLMLDLNIPPTKYVEGTRRASLLTEAVERLRGIAGVQAAAGAQCPPVSGVCVDTAFTMADHPVTSVIDIPTAASNIVTPGYFEVMGVPILAGRLFSATDTPTSQLVVIVNHTFATRHWPNASAIGQQVREGGPAAHQPYRTVIGVVGDMKQNGLDVEARPEVFLPVTQFPFAPWTELPGMTLMLRTAGDPTAIAGNAQRALIALDQDLPVTGVRTMTAHLSRTLERRRFATMLIAGVALLAMLLVALGIYGVMAYTVNQRRHEIAVRLALGATPGSIRVLMLRRALFLSGLGVAVGWAGSAGVTHLLTSVLVGVTPLDPATFLAVATVLLLVALLASIVPLERASTIDPAAITRDS
jgi:putative ABC transport system permease protein